jgi:hypothetical protein
MAKHGRGPVDWDEVDGAASGDAPSHVSWGSIATAVVLSVLLLAPGIAFVTIQAP